MHTKDFPASRRGIALDFFIKLRHFNIIIAVCVEEGALWPHKKNSPYWCISLENGNRDRISGLITWDLLISVLRKLSSMQRTSQPASQVFFVWMSGLLGNGLVQKELESICRPYFWFLSKEKEVAVHEDCLDSPDQYSWTASLDTKDSTASVISSDDCNCWCIHHPIKDSPTFFYPFVFASIPC